MKKVNEFIQGFARFTSGLMVLGGLLIAYTGFETSNVVMYSTNLILLGIALVGGAVYILVYQMYNMQKEAIETAADSASRRP